MELNELEKSIAVNILKKADGEDVENIIETAGWNDEYLLRSLIMRNKIDVIMNIIDEKKQLETPDNTPPIEEQTFTYAQMKRLFELMIDTVSEAVDGLSSREIVDLDSADFSLNGNSIELDYVDINNDSIMEEINNNLDFDYMMEDLLGRP